MQMSVDGTAFDVLDEGAGPAIVLIHGLGLAKETWDAQAAALAPRARVIRFDLRGLGRSAVTPGPYLMETLAGDLAGILDTLGVERATLVGHSLGGYVAFAFYRMFAERVRALGFVCTRAVADTAQEAAQREALAERVEAEGIEPFVASYFPRYMAPEAYEQGPALAARLRALVAATPPAGAAGMLRGMAMRVSAEDLLGDIVVPVRVIGGTRDAISPLELSRHIAEAIPGATLDALDCGHLPLYEAPEALSASLTALLETTAAPR